MAMQEIKLARKIQLTENVFELHYDFGKKVEMKPGQFVTFILPGIGGRSYSILEKDGNIAKLTVKRRDTKDGGRGGSVLLCDALVGDIFKVVGPAGHFLLQKNNDTKFFIGTGTGIVPLYNQIISALEEGKKFDMKLVFGVRKQTDLFYINILEKLANTYANFSFTVCISREDVAGFETGYVTKCLTPETLDTYKEYYVCGMPDMIDSCIEKLKEFGISEEKIFFERYA